MYRVLVPVDRDVERASAQAEAVARLPDAAASVAASVLHVFETAEGGTEPADVGAVRRVEELLADAGVATELEGRVGEPADAILAAAEAVGADELVLGGRKRSPIGSLLFGSVSQAVLRDASRPVTITGSEVKEDPSHRCRSCGRAYYAAPSTDIVECHRCGGTRVEPADDAPAVAASR